MKPALAGALAAAALASASRGDTMQSSPQLANVQAVFYVCAASGDDANSGDEAAPFRTIPRAQGAVRETIAAGMTGDVVVHLRGGVYYLDAALHFDARDSGRDGHQVIYRSYPGERAEIVGGRPVSGWEHVGDGLYRAPMPKDRVFWALFENGQWCPPAREPNEGYLRAADGSQTAEGTTVTFAEGDLPEPFDWRHARVAIWAGAFHEGNNYDWWETIAPIEEVDWDTRTIRLATRTYWNASKGNRYYVMGAKAFLDQPGEWHLDRDEGALYYRPRRTPIEEQCIVAPTTKSVIRVEGESMDRLAENIVFQDLVLSQSDAPGTFAPGVAASTQGLVYMRNARNISLRDCHIYGAGGNGVSFEQYNQGHVVSGCLIEEVGYCAVMVLGFWPGGGPFNSPAEAFVNRGHTITDNYLRGGGRRVGHGSGVWIHHSGENEVSYNLIEDMPRYGVELLGSSYEFMKPAPERGHDGVYYGQTVTWENHMEFIHTRGNRIVFNELRDLMKNGQDGGAITAWGTGTGNVISDNLIHSMNAFWSQNHGILIGIYLDDAAKHFTVTRNVVARLSGSDMVYPFLIKGVHNVVSNNIAADNQARASFYMIKAGLAGLPDSVPGVEDEPVEHATFTRNIAYQRGGSTVYQFYPWTDTMVAESDHNVFYHPDGAYQVVIDWRPVPWEEWRRLLGGKYDQHSVLADPEFTDPEHFDYRLRPGSPALALGFEEIDLSRVGPRPGFRFAAQIEQANRRFGR